MIERYYKGESIVDILGSKEKQTPNKRYQLQMFLENMISFQEDFIKIGKELLDSNEIRYYNKYAFLEVLGQFEKENIDSEIEKFILEYCEDEVWGNIIINNVIKYNLEFYRLIRNNNKLEKWINSKNKSELALDLLIDIAPNYEEEDISLIKKYFLEDEKDIQRVRNCFRFDISYDTDYFFDFRLKFLNKYDLNSTYIDFNKCFKQNEIRTIKYWFSTICWGGLKKLIFRNVNCK